MPETTYIGFVSLNKREHGYELGYGFLKEFQGHGYAKESLTAIFSMIKELGAEKIYAGTALNNLPSVRLLESLSFEFEGTESLSFHKDSSGNDIRFEGGKYELTL